MARCGLLSVLYLYLLTVRCENSIWAWRRLALALTLLFFEKYNYWLLVILALLADQFAVDVSGSLPAPRGT